ncbi:MAG: N-methylhydantoinase A/oxoprolinase/acetone carboxylase beta subunit [Pseudohongiellaceae bacterium]|jgi:N-methylhydantoinase A/oxoprolinase/acetone carboxylase beta subunit
MIMGKLINIDNGGTLTDFCAFDGDKVFHTKSLTTPFDLSKCFFDGLKKLSKAIYGDEAKVAELLQDTDYIRYSTTQGTNALVERKGPRLGLLVGKGTDIASLQATGEESSLYNDIVGDRVAEIDLTLSGAELELDVMRAVNRIAGEGAGRIVLSVCEEDFQGIESKLNRIISRKFPSHLLGVVPVLAAGGLSDDEDFARRTWSALLNAFLHPAMERFLYSADHRLKDLKTKNPLLIFRNDGGAARVAKTMAIKTYSSGPRGGMEGVRELAKHYGYKKLLSYDVGGTTTDIGVVVDGELAQLSQGTVEGVKVNFPLAEIFSAGVGGSSIITSNGTDIIVGPESVGAAPGPACFGLGGKQATITDVFLLLGVLDPATYFGGELDLDSNRAADAIQKNVAEPMGVNLNEALDLMFAAWVQKIAEGILKFSDVDADTTLAGFGGAGALAATRIADACGARRVIIPALGAVFSAFGIGFSPISQVYRMNLVDKSSSGIEAVIKEARVRAEKDLYAEGVDISECEIRISLSRIGSNGLEQVIEIGEGSLFPSDFMPDEKAVLVYEARKNIGGLKLADVGGEASRDPNISGLRKVNTGAGNHVEIPVVRVEDQLPGAVIDGPLIIEESFFTGLVDKGWTLSVSGNSDLILEKK